MATTNVYILRLEGGKYYIGKSDNVKKRFAEHVCGNGSSWTRKYKPVNIEKIIPNASPFEEDKVTKEYMAKYGIEKVRGGSYVSDELSASQKKTLQKEIWMAKDLCTRCGRKGHFIRDCYASSDVSGKYLIGSDTDSDSEYDSDSDSEDDTCYRCGRQGHYISECYASTDVNGYYI